MRIAQGFMEGAQGYYRFHLPASAMDGDLDIVDLHDVLSIEVGSDGELRVAPMDVDLLILQRPMDHRMPEVIEQLRSQGVAVVVDVDDRLEDIHPANASYDEIHPSRNATHNVEHLKRCCAVADVVTVSTPPLAACYAPHGRVAVLRNCVPQSHLDLVATPGDAFGWTGWVGYHPGDLDVVGDAVAREVASGRAFRSIGPADGVAEALGLEAVDATGWVDFADYPNVLATLTTLIAPLADLPFNRAGKSFLKPLEAMALGVPVVCSDLPEYRMLVDAGAGIAAGTRDEWRRALRRSADPAWQDEQRFAGRVVAARWAIERHHHAWREVWESAITHLRDGVWSPRDRRPGVAASTPDPTLDDITTDHDTTALDTPVPDEGMDHMNEQRIRFALAEDVVVVVGPTSAEKTVADLVGPAVLFAPVEPNAAHLLEDVVGMLHELASSFTETAPTFLVLPFSFRDDLARRLRTRGHHVLETDDLRAQLDLATPGATAPAAEDLPPTSAASTLMTTRRPAIDGGEPAFDRPRHVGAPNIVNREGFQRRLDELLDRNWLTNMGPLVQEFERRVADIAGVDHCVAVSNGTVGLEIAARASGLSGEVIVPSWTFVATAHALQWQEISPVFADVDPTTHTLDPERVAAMITPRTTGVIGVHLFGRPCDVAGLRAVCDEHGLKLLFDAAHAFGNTHRDQAVGSLGDAEVFSFHATKFLNTFEGGAIVTDDEDLATAIRHMTNFGFTGRDEVGHLGTNGKMSEVAAAMGLAQLDVLSTTMTANYERFLTYERGLVDIPGISLRTPPPEERNNHQYVVVEVDAAAAGLTRDELLAFLEAENVLARRYFFPGCHRMEPYRSHQPHAGLLLPATEHLAETVLVLPTGTAMSLDDVMLVTELVTAAVDRAHSGAGIPKDRALAG